MRPIYEWDVFKINIPIDVAYAATFKIVAATFLILEICLITCLNLVATNLHYSEIPWIIPNLLHVASLFMAALFVCIPCQWIAGVALGFYKRRCIDGWL